MLNFQNSTNDKLTKVAPTFMNPFFSWVVFGYKYKNTQVEVA